jgi:uncharacterized membrane protein
MGGHVFVVSQILLGSLLLLNHFRFLYFSKKPLVRKDYYYDLSYLNCSSMVSCQMKLSLIINVRVYDYLLIAQVHFIISTIEFMKN